MVDCLKREQPAGNEASWRSGYAEDCKSSYGGSIPSEASNFPAYGTYQFGRAHGHGNSFGTREFRAVAP
jgi:hypothetical protein